jgi:hypothetical protein
VDHMHLLRLQEGVITRAQAHRHGLTWARIRSQIDAGRWQRVHGGVLVGHTGPITDLQRVWAAVLAAGPGAVASHDTGLWLWDRSVPLPAVLHVTVPIGTGPPRVRGVQVHRSRRLSPADVHPSAAPPRVRVERAVLDVAAAAAAGDRAVAIVAWAVQRGLTTAERLAVALEAYPTFPRRALLRQVIRLTGSGAHSLIEVLFVRTVLAHGLPPPRQQVRRGRGRVDAEYDGLVIELDGRFGHFNASGWWRDMGRDNEHTVDGRATLRFPGSSCSHRCRRSCSPSPGRCADLGGPARCVARADATAARNAAGGKRPTSERPDGIPAAGRADGRPSDVLGWGTVQPNQRP